MSSFLCFICHSTVNSDTNEDIREKYREVVGMHLCPDSHLCYICCHVLNKLWLFRAVCLKRSLEYPVLFSEKGTINLQRNDLEYNYICSYDTCGQYQNRNVNSKFIHISYQNYNEHFDSQYENHQGFHAENQYVELEEDRNDFINKDDAKHYENHQKFNENDHYMALEREKDDFYEPNPENNAYYKNDHVTDAFYKNKNLNDCKFYQRDDNVNNFYANDRGEDIHKENEETVVACYNKVETIANDNHRKIEHSGIDINYIKNNAENHTTDIEDNFQDDQSKNDSINSNQNNELVDNEVFEDSSPTNKIGLQALDHIENEGEVTLNEIANAGVENANGKSKGKKKKSKKKSFKKIVLSLDEQKSELEKKRKSKKYLEAKFKCYNCALGFLFKDTYQTHMMRHEESNGEYRCGTCTLRFATATVLRCHRAIHGKRYKCGKCDKEVRTRARRTHARECWGQSDDVAACHLCARLFRDTCGLQQHLKRYHQSKNSDRTYRCTVCGKTYKNQAAVRTHMIKHENRKFECTTCGSSFSSPYTLSQHKKKHAPASVTEQLHYCSLCNIGYRTHRDLQEHKRKALNHQQTVFECPICSRSCPNRRSLASHMESVHSCTKNYGCGSCGARYSSRKSLLRHAATHTRSTQPKLAVCHMCGNQFKGNNKLNRHLREVCEKAKLEEEFANLYDQGCLNPH